jgi:hypothetical protein
MWKCSGTISRNVMLDTMSDLVGKVCRKIIKWMSEVSGRMSTMKKEGRTTED